MLVMTRRADRGVDWGPQRCSEGSWQRTTGSFEAMKLKGPATARGFFSPVARAPGGGGAGRAPRLFPGQTPPPRPRPPWMRWT